MHHRNMQRGFATLYILIGLSASLAASVWFGLHQVSKNGELTALRDADKATYDGNLKKAAQANENWGKSYNALASEFAKRQMDILDRDRRVAVLKKELKSERDKFKNDAQLDECRDVMRMRICPQLFDKLRDPTTRPHPGNGTIAPDSEVPRAIVHDGRGDSVPAD